METVTLLLPYWAIVAMTNDDYSGCTVEEEEACKKLMHEYGYITTDATDEEAVLCSCNDMPEPFGKMFDECLFCEAERRN